MQFARRLACSQARCGPYALRLMTRCLRARFQLSYAYEGHACAEHGLGRVFEPYP